MFSAKDIEHSKAHLRATRICWDMANVTEERKARKIRKFWAILLPPLALIIISGTAISNLALGYENAVQTLLLSSATFNANVVSTGLVLGYVSQKLSNPKK